MGGIKETWEMSYKAENGSISRLLLIKTKRTPQDYRSPGLEELQIKISDFITSFSISVLKDEAGLLYVNLPQSTLPFTRKTSYVLSSVLETDVYKYESATRTRLIVKEEWKKMRGNELMPFMATVAFYYTYGTYIGLSIVIYIRVSDDGYLDLDVDGPIQHPTSALFYMFDEVTRTGLWKPTMCPHCAAVKKQRSK
ncbi:uncharacterized protein LOC113866522 [Abrus precatorius]|uniref:Uncharacterized protein LOC113866522 n=1 Tax=Abrus precatorius TaxID=3816 RepID=A0A8B8LP18_ABRPR|nr:uncharacterized protein LOC113866522 [Abrus precatorius]